MNRILQMGKNALLWILSVFFAIIATEYFPNRESIALILAILLIIPIEPWQAFLGKYIKGKGWIVAVLFIAAVAFGAIDAQNTASPEPEPMEAPAEAWIEEPDE